VKVASCQSNYMPWKGYFDMIARADLFIFYDDVQYTRHDWRNRNYIKTHEGRQMLTVPCHGHSDLLICDVKINGYRWQQKHWQTLVYTYQYAPFFERYRNWLKSVYLKRRWDSLSELNQATIQYIAKEILGIDTQFEDSRHYPLIGKKLERTLSLVDHIENIEELILGPAAQNYIDPEQLKKRNIRLSYMDYSAYLEYPQFYKPFIHEVSILDLLFHTGPNAMDYMKHVRKELRQ